MAANGEERSMAVEAEMQENLFPSGRVTQGMRLASCARGKYEWEAAPGETIPI